MIWSQHYDPLGSPFLSPLIAALPVLVLLGGIAVVKIRVHYAAWAGLLVALAVAMLAYRMPWPSALAAAGYGAAYGLFPIGWIVLNLIFLYGLTVEKGSFDTLKAGLASLAPDPRLQVLLIAFCFGAFFEGAAGFGTPVAVSAAMLIGLGFKPMQASGLSLIANTAPVAFGALGTPIIALSAVTGLDLHRLSAMVGRQLPFFSLVIPFWVVCAMSGWRGMIGVWPAALVAGAAFALPQFLVSNLHGPWLVDVIASVSSMGALTLLLAFWQPRALTAAPQEISPSADSSAVVRQAPARAAVLRAWLPWFILSFVLFVWGMPQVKRVLNTQPWRTVAVGALKASVAPTVISIDVPGLHDRTRRAPPVAAENAPPEPAVFSFNWLSATGTAILLAALISGGLMGFSLFAMAAHYLKTLHRIRFSLCTIAGMLALGYVTKYSGTDATLGLAIAHTGSWYPFFGTLLGWLGVALTGSDTASNVLFGGLQRISAEQTGVDPVLMCAANSSGGVMGKMIDAQSIVVASTATNWYGHEGSILRYVFFHSLALAALVGIWVYLQATTFPFTCLVP